MSYFPSPDDNIGYRGPSEHWQPEEGSNQQGPPTNFPNYLSGYHNLNLLQSLLDQIISETTSLIADIETFLSTYNLKTDVDPKLAEIQNASWPTWQLGPARGYVSYAQYKALAGVGTADAAYIRKVYVDKMRGAGGTNSIDLINIATCIHQEAQHVKDFIDDAIGVVSDSAEYRALELFQDWATAALGDTRSFRSWFAAKGQGLQQIPSSEVDPLAPDQARQYQAVFQVKLNILNKNIDNVTTDLDKQTGLLSEIFYKRFFAPALKMKLNVTNELDRAQTGGTILGQQATQAVQGLTLDYVTALTDQLHNNTNYTSKMREFQDRLAARDTYVSFINQLVQKGASVPNPWINTQIPGSEKAGWENLQPPPAATPDQPLKGDKGDKGAQGDPGMDATPGLPGADGIDGNIFDVQDEGILILSNPEVLNFVGSGVTVTEATPGTAQIYIPGGGATPNTGGSGLRFASIVIAASDTDLKDQDVDYICTGTDDDITINTAIDALGSGGGEIVFLEGTYYINDTIAAEHTTFRGMGPNTYLLCSVAGEGEVNTIGFTNGPIILEIDSKLQNLTVALTEDVKGKTAVNLTGYSAIEDCFFIDCGVTGDTEFDPAFGCLYRNNTFTGYIKAFAIQTGEDETSFIIEGNRFIDLTLVDNWLTSDGSESIIITTYPGGLINNNEFRNSSAYYGIRASGIISNNKFDSDCKFFNYAISADRSIVNDNIIDGITLGIDITDDPDIVADYTDPLYEVAGIYLDNSSAANNSINVYAKDIDYNRVYGIQTNGGTAIFIDANTVSGEQYGISAYYLDHSTVQGNTVYGSIAGIWIQDGVDTISVTDNVGWDAGVTILDESTSGNNLVKHNIPPLDVDSGESPWEYGSGTGSAQLIDPASGDDASGNYAVVAGKTNIGSGENSFTGGNDSTNAAYSSIVYGNTITVGASGYNAVFGSNTSADDSTYYSIIGGSTVTATDFNYSIAVGSSIDCSGTYSAVFGSNTVTEDGTDYNLIAGSNCAIKNGASYNLVAGANCIADGASYNLTVGTGCESHADATRVTGYGACGWFDGQAAHAQYGSVNDIFGDQTAYLSDGQASQWIPQRKTLNATPVALNIPITFFDYPFLIDFKGRVIARKTSTDVASVWEIEATVSTDGSAGARFVGTPVITMIRQDAGASTWDVNWDLTGLVLSIMVTGQAATTIAWTGNIDCTEALGFQ